MLKYLAIVAIVANIFFIGMILGRNKERKSWCVKHQLTPLYDKCLNNGALKD